MYDFNGVLFCLFTSEPLMERTIRWSESNSTSIDLSWINIG